MLEKKGAQDKVITELAAKAADLLKQRDTKAGLIGNIVDKDCHISETEVSASPSSLLVAMAKTLSPCELSSHQDDNPIMRVWHPEPNHKGNSEPGLQLEDKTEGIISHHEVLARLEAYDPERGA